MLTKSRTGLVAGVLGIAGALISALRLWLGNSESLGQVLWAEDGVFPLCINKADFASCVVDPFAGYLLLAPRLLAGIVALFPLSDWVVITNVLAAIVAGLIVALAYVILRRGGMGQFVSILGALVPVVIPIVGLEAIQALGSVYMPLLYVSVLAVVFSSALNRWMVFALLLLTVLTIPTAVLILPLVLLWWVLRTITLSTFGLWAGALIVGGALQLLVASGAAKPRVVELGPEGVSTWANSVLPAFMTNVPGFGTDGSDASVFPSIEQWSLGWLVVVGILVAATGLFIFVSRFAGALIFMGLLFSAFPAVFDGPGNRYFVVPVMLWSLAIFVSLNGVLVRSRWWVSGIVVVVVLALWLPALPAGAFRSTPAPAWSDEVARVSAACKSDPALVERIVFTPFWPPNWGDALSEPTHPSVDCLVVWKWIEPANAF